MHTEDLMTREPASVTATDTARKAAQLLSDNDCGCLPVVESAASRRVIGVLTDRDIAIRGVARGKSPDTPVRELMTTDVAMVGAADNVEKVERVMSDRQVRRVVVVDDDRRCIGIVSQADLALAAKRGEGVDDRAVARVVEEISEPATVIDS